MPPTMQKVNQFHNEKPALYDTFQVFHYDLPRNILGGYHISLRCRRSNNKTYQKMAHRTKGARRRGGGIRKETKTRNRKSSQGKTNINADRSGRRQSMKRKMPRARLRVGKKSRGRRVGVPKALLRPTPLRSDEHTLSIWNWITGFKEVCCDPNHESKSPSILCSCIVAPSRKRPVAMPVASIQSALRE